jgi:hypothetical protein
MRRETPACAIIITLLVTANISRKGALWRRTNRYDIGGKNAAVARFGQFYISLLKKHAGIEKLNSPKIIFLLAMMIAERNFHRRLAGASRYLGDMRVTGTGRHGGGAR